jgi:acyl phosphate:glycerol-3-phosphate acyltransferase
VPILSYIVVGSAAYLLGSIPTGYLVGRARGIDIRTVGSGNIGATNSMRVLGKPAGIFVLLVDCLKGYVACTWLATLALKFFTVAPEKVVTLQIVAGIFVVLGHNYTCWLKFKGGKGIATSAGVVAALVPWALLIVFGVWIILLLATRYVSVGSIVAAFALPFATWFTTNHNLQLTVITGGLGALAIYKHISNIQRLRNGTENRVTFKKKDSQ